MLPYFRCGAAKQTGLQLRISSGQPGKTTELPHQVWLLFLCIAMAVFLSLFRGICDFSAFYFGINRPLSFFCSQENRPLSSCFVPRVRMRPQLLASRSFLHDALPCCHKHFIFEYSFCDAANKYMSCKAKAFFAI